MKTKLTILILGICLQQFAAVAQTLSISGNTTNIEPLSAQTYILNVSGLPAGAKNLVAVWTITGHTNGMSIVHINGTSPTILSKQLDNVQWPNSPNGVDKFTIQARLNWSTIDGIPMTGLTPKLQIQVKYIGPINNLNIAGSSYLNGQTRTHSCGTGSITLTSSVPVTDPTAAVQYLWYFPSGWSPEFAATTVPTVTVVPTNAGEGVIQVKANRADGTTYQSLSVNLKRPLPTITSVSSENILTCSPSSTVTLSASGSNADSFTWQPSSLVNINGVNANVNTSSPVTVGSSGTGSIDVYAKSSACGVLSQNSKTVQVRFGPPVITDTLINGIPISWYDPYYPAEVPNGSRIAIPSYNAASYSWTLLAGTAPIWPVTGNEHMCDISYIIDYARIEGKATNSCGSITYLFYLVPPGGSMLVAYPNPATETLTLQLPIVPQQINLYTEASTVAVMSFNSKAINDLKSTKDGKHQLMLNVKDLPRGIYYLYIEKEDKKTEKIRVQLI